jgi:hypothetical protein
MALGNSFWDSKFAARCSSVLICCIESWATAGNEKKAMVRNKKRRIPLDPSLKKGEDVAFCVRMESGLLGFIVFAIC